MCNSAERIIQFSTMFSLPTHIVHCKAATISPHLQAISVNKVTQRTQLYRTITVISFVTIADVHYAYCRCHWPAPLIAVCIAL